MLNSFLVCFIYSLVKCIKKNCQEISCPFTNPIFIGFIFKRSTPGNVGKQTRWHILKRHHVTVVDQKGATPQCSPSHATPSLGAKEGVVMLFEQSPSWELERLCRGVYWAILSLDLIISISLKYSSVTWVNCIKERLC